MLQQETSETIGGPVPRLEAQGTGSAISVSPSAQKIVIIGSPFVRTGSIAMAGQALRIRYSAFDKTHEAIIETRDLERLVRDRFAPPAPVKQIRQGIDGTQVTDKIGYACRTVSGKALKIQTSTSDGDMVVSWTTLLQVVNQKIRSAHISRIKNNQPEAPRPAQVSVGRNIRAGLATGF
ncbi:hypothetical protein [Methanoregula formicica]|nr:hypothetical protein [Methanoregula formicica]